MAGYVTVHVYGWIRYAHPSKHQLLPRRPPLGIDDKPDMLLTREQLRRFAGLSDFGVVGEERGDGLPGLILRERVGEGRKWLRSGGGSWSDHVRRETTGRRSDSWQE